MEHDTAGDPITGLKWTRRTTEKIAGQLQLLGIVVCSNSVARLLRELGFSLRVNHKKLSSGCGVDRNKQFSNIAESRENFSENGDPVISVDTKKKEMVGNFKNRGTAYSKQPLSVHDHDFPSLADGIAIPYGVYDVAANRGSVIIGVSHDTPKFAVSAIDKWWRYDGCKRYGKSKKLLILADCGGSNGYRSRIWKHELQKIADRRGLSITVRHYPPGASKWNPIEHRLFSEISKNWAGRPLDSYVTIQNYIRTTTTKSGLRVKAYLEKRQYENGERVSDEEMKQLNIEAHAVLSQWNYTIAPRKMGSYS